MDTGAVGEVAVSSSSLMVTLTVGIVLDHTLTELSEQWASQSLTDDIWRRASSPDAGATAGEVPNLCHDGVQWMALPPCVPAVNVSTELERLKPGHPGWYQHQAEVSERARARRA